MRTARACGAGNDARVRTPLRNAIRGIIPAWPRESDRY
jgi:hypothetical protein